MNNLRYYILYLLTPLMAVSSGMLLNSGDVYKTLFVEGLVAVYWLLLAILTEETMRAVDDFHKVPVIWSP